LPDVLHRAFVNAMLVISMAPIPQHIIRQACCIAGELAIAIAGASDLGVAAASPDLLVAAADRLTDCRGALQGELLLTAATAAADIVGQASAQGAEAQQAAKQLLVAVVSCQVRL
jgi:hypothetical protein